MWVKESFCQDEQPDCKAPALRMLAAILNSSTDLFQWALNKYWTAEVKKKKKSENKISKSLSEVFIFK